jgi:4-oxalocrotonate tautomerase
MPFVEIKVIEGVFSHDEKREIVERVSETLIDIEGEGLRGSTHTVITETPSGEWAIGGRAFTAEEVKKSGGLPPIPRRLGSRSPRRRSSSTQ